MTNVVDGDTIDVDHDGEERRIRLLNVDTPESTDPDAEPECLGQEATEFLESLLPKGTEVKLEGDEEPQDQYGRYLAGVFLDEVLVNAEIAREGLGAAVLFEPNDRFYDDVLAAQEEARQAGRGLYDPSADCTLPSQVAQFGDTGEALTDSTVAADAALEDLEGYAEELALAVAAGLAIGELLDGDRSRFPLLAFSSIDVGAMRRSTEATSANLDRAVRETTGAIEAERQRIAEEEARRAAEEEARRAAEEEARRAAEEEARRAAEEEARRAAEEEARQAAEAAERHAAEQEAAHRATQEAEAQRQQQAEQEQRERARTQQPQRQSDSGSSGGGSGSGGSGSAGGSGPSGGYDGYTGCRAYGGQPPNAVDEQGRSYTKIDCTTKLPIG